MKKLISIFIFVTCFIFSGISQDIQFSFAVNYSGNTAQVQVFAQKASAGTENMAGFTTNIYFDNTQTTLTSFDFSPSTALGWDVSESSSNFIANNNSSVNTSHTGYGQINVIDQNIVGTDVGTTQLHILNINFDNSIGTGGDAFLAGTSNNHPAQEYVGIDFIGHPVVIIGPQSTPLNQGPLPVELIYFDARPTAERTTKLSWQTATEQNNDYFVVEKSTDGTQFEFLEEVSGAGNSDQMINYRTYDLQPTDGFNYYRLKQIDFDGTFEYSEIRVVDLKKMDMIFSIYPNPTDDELHLQFEEPIIKGLLQLFDSAGKLVVEKELNPTQNNPTLYLAHLPKGMYTLRANLNNNTFTKKVILQ